MTTGSTEFVLAQVNLGRTTAPLDSPQLKDFTDNLAPVNAVADASPGFIWRLTGDGDDATDLSVFDDESILVNMSVWRDPDALVAFMYQGMHRELLSRRREFFVRSEHADTALWWIPAGHTPTVAEAEERVLHLRANGPTPYAFTLRHTFPAPDSAALAPAQHSADEAR